MLKRENVWTNLEMLLNHLNWPNGSVLGNYVTNTCRNNKIYLLWYLRVVSRVSVSFFALAREVKNDSYIFIITRYVLSIVCPVGTRSCEKIASCDNATATRSALRSLDSLSSAWPKNGARALNISMYFLYSCRYLARFARSMPPAASTTYLPIRLLRTCT